MAAAARASRCPRDRPPRPSGAKRQTDSPSTVVVALDLRTPLPGLDDRSGLEVFAATAASGRIRPMTSREALRRLARNREKLRTYSVRHIAVFGSTARDQATIHSDVDLLVEFDPEAKVGLFTFVDLLDFLTDAMGTRIDLATPGALRPEMREVILAQAVRAF
jgi:predicted nucleotidyltransferase